MEDVFVFVRRDGAPTAEEAEQVEGVHVDLDQGEALGEPFDAAELDYAEAVVGPFRIDTIGYRSTHLLADALERLYAERVALADADSDALLTVPELVALLRGRPDAPSFFAWADPAKR